MNDELIDAYAACLRALEAGVSPETAAANYPELAEELRPLLRAAAATRAMGQAALPSRAAEAASRARLLAQAARPSRVSGFGFLPSAWRVALASLIVVLALAASGYGLVVASASSLPGEPLYPVKRTVERLRLLFAPDEESRRELESEFDTRRADEARTVIEEGLRTEVEFTGRIVAMNADEWRIGDFNVRLVEGTRLEGTPRIGALAEVQGLAQADETVIASEIIVKEQAVEATEGFETDEPPTATRPAVTPSALPSLTASPSETAPPTATPLPATATAPGTDTATPAASTPTATAPPTATGVPPTATPAPSSTPTATDGEGDEVEFTATLEAINSNVWRIGGQDVIVDANTEIEGNPQIGQRLHVHAIRRNNGLFAKEIEVEDHSSTSSTPGGSATAKPSKTPTPTESPEPSETRRPTRTPTP